MAEQKKKINILYIAAAVIVVIAAIAVILSKTGVSTDETADTAPENDLTAAVSADGKIHIPSAEVADGITFYDYTAEDGTAMQFMLVKGSDGEVRGALNTCQVCNGSPYAYFVAGEDSVTCQNCRNVFPSDAVGVARGGCNPAPIEVSEENGEYIVDAEYLNSVSVAFVNWKKGI